MRQALRQTYMFINHVQAIAELRAAFGEDSISTDDEDLHRHGYSEWSSINIDQLPVAVAYPKSTEEVSQLARVCHKYKIPMSGCYTEHFELDTEPRQSRTPEDLVWKPTSLHLLGA